MKIFYIPSGYQQIYQSFDKSIIRAIQKLDHKVQSIPLYEEEKLRTAILSFHPDVVLTMMGFNMSNNLLEWIQNQGIKLAVWMTEDPYYIDRSIKIINEYNYIFTIDIAALKVYKETGHKNVSYLPLGTDPSIYHPTTSSKEYESDICLIGYPYPNRINMIYFLLENTNYHIQLVGSQWEKKLVKSMRTPKLTIHSRWIPPMTAKHYYHNATINLNTHRPYNFKQNKNTSGILNQSINNRTFDIASCEAFQLIEYKFDLPNHFIEGKEIVSFTSHGDLLKKVDYYMSHDHERKAISKGARENVINNHTFVHRLKAMINILSAT